jgi:hypothetical protein
MAANLVTNLFAYPDHTAVLLEGDVVGRLLRAMGACEQSSRIHLAVCVALHNIAATPVGRASVLTNQGLQRIFRSMVLHENVRLID